MKALAVLAVAVSVAAILPGRTARAGAIVPSLTIDASSSVGQDALHLTPTLQALGGGVYSAHIDDSATSFSLLLDLELHADPSIAGSFTLTNLSGTTQTFSVSATLSLLSLAGPTTVSGSFGSPPEFGVTEATYTDLNNSSFVQVTTALFFQARIDGSAVASLGSFNPQSASGGPGVSGTLSPEFFGPTGGQPGVTSSIGVAFPGFSLTAGDRIAVPFEFRVVPEPDFAFLFAVVGAVFLARAARKSPR